MSSAETFVFTAAQEQVGDFVIRNEFGVGHVLTGEVHVLQPKLVHQIACGPEKLEQRAEDASDDPAGCAG